MQPKVYIYNFYWAIGTRGKRQRHSCHRSNHLLRQMEIQFQQSRCSLEKKREHLTTPIEAAGTTDPRVLCGIASVGSALGAVVTLTTVKLKYGGNNWSGIFEVEGGHPLAWGGLRWCWAYFRKLTLGVWWSLGLLAAVLTLAALETSIYSTITLAAV